MKERVLHWALHELQICPRTTPASHEPVVCSLFANWVCHLGNSVEAWNLSPLLWQRLSDCATSNTVALCTHIPLHCAGKAGTDTTHCMSHKGHTKDLRDWIKRIWGFVTYLQQMEQRKEQQVGLLGACQKYSGNILAVLSAHVIW